LQASQYIVIGGMAMIQSGFLRATEDIDLLIEGSRENQTKVQKALSYLPDNAVREMQPTDLDEFTVVRIADEFDVDLLLQACGKKYEDVKEEIRIVQIEDVRIPFATPNLLFQLKQTEREKDKLDLMYLKEMIRKQNQ
jgi:hypothetical protein